MSSPPDQTPGPEKSSDRPAIGPALARARRAAFGTGFIAAFGVPGLVLLGTSMGFGALAHDAGATLGQTIFLTMALYALPAQVVFVEEMARGAGLVVVAFAVGVTAIRLLPMTVSLVPFFRGDPGHPAWKVAAAHTVAITPWLEAQIRLPKTPPELRLPLYLGLGYGVMLVTIFGAVAGFLVAGRVPPIVALALLFLTPVYFLLSLIKSARTAAGWIALVGGATLGPIVYRALPNAGVDLLITGLIAGTVAWLIERRGGNRL